MHDTYEVTSGVAIASRGSFVTNVYLHVAAALLAFVAIEYFLFASGAAAVIAAPLSGNWLLVIGGLVLVSYLASRFSARRYGALVQYPVLAAFVLAQAVVSVPLVALLAYSGGADLLAQAAYVTAGMTVALIAVVHVFKTNFSFLGPLLAVLGILALVLIVTSIIFGFTLGTLFVYAMVAYAAGAILYETSSIIRTYEDGEYVAAALALVSSIILLFWYVAQALLGSGDE